MKMQKLSAVVSIALGVLAVLALPAKCDDPRSVELHPDRRTHVNWERGHDCPPDDIKITEYNFKSWQVLGGGCDQVGQPCPTVQTLGKNHDFIYSFPEGKSYSGKVRLVLVAYADIPICQGSIPPSCPLAGPYDYVPVMFLDDLSQLVDSDAWCI